MSLHAPVVAGHDVVPRGHQRRPVDGLQGRLHTPALACLGDAVDEFGRVQHRLARDAAAVQTRPADLVPLDEHDVETEGGGTQGGAVTAGAAADDDDVR